MRKSFAVILLFVAMTAGAAEISINQADKQFSMPSVTIKSGDTLVFHNADTVDHNVNIISPNGDADDKGVQSPGDTLKVTFSKPGDYQARCRIHPRMKMSVTVQ